MYYTDCEKLLKSIKFDNTQLAKCNTMGKKFSITDLNIFGNQKLKNYCKYIDRVPYFSDGTYSFYNYILSFKGVQ